MLLDECIGDLPLIENSGFRYLEYGCAMGICQDGMLTSASFESQLVNTRL